MDLGGGHLKKKVEDGLVQVLMHVPCFDICTCQSKATGRELNWGMMRTSPRPLSLGM